MKRVFIDDTHQATIICPKCGTAKNIDATNFKDTNKRIKAKCRCGEVFRVTLEFRRHYRKKVRLPGEYFVRGTDEKGEIIIEDISLSGIRFASLKPHNVSRNDLVEFKFTLDNPMKTIIHAHVKIKWIIDRNVGAQFVDPKSIKKDLGFYLRT